MARSGYFRGICGKTAIESVTASRLCQLDGASGSSLKVRMDQDLESTFREDYAGLCRYAYRIVSDPDDAAEVVQETFLRFHRMRDQRGSAPDRVLLYRVARNLAIDCLRRKQTRRRHLERHAHVLVLPQAESTEERLIEQERRRQLHKALQCLKPRDVEAITLRSEGLSYSDIALVLDLHPGSVGPTITRALRKLRDAYLALSQEGEDPSRRVKAAETPLTESERPFRIRTRSAG